MSQSPPRSEKNEKTEKETKKQDSLFLIEALVDKIVFPPNPQLPELPEKDFRTCVTVECKNVEPIEICDDDPDGVVHKSGGGLIKVFNCGKSCLFFLNDADIQTAMSKFPVTITIYKALPCGCLPAKLIIGETVIDLTKEFVEARNTFLKDPSCVSSQALKDAFVIKDTNGQIKAEIVMFLRISCFGKLIVTRFQGGAPSLKMGQKSSEASCHSKPGSSQSNLPCTAGHGHGVCPPARDPYKRRICEDPEDPCYCSGPHQPPRQPVACRNTDQYCLHVPKGASLPYSQDLSEEQVLTLRGSQTADGLEKQGEMEIINLFKRKSHNYSKKPNIQNASRSCFYYSSSRIKNYSKRYYPCSFGSRVMVVYNVTVDKSGIPSRASGTQATALMNKCMQVETESLSNSVIKNTINDSYKASSGITDSLYHKNPLLNPMVCFWGKKSSRKFEQDSKAVATDFSSQTSTVTNSETQKDRAVKRRISIADDSTHRSKKSTKNKESDSKLQKRSSKTGGSSGKNPKSSSGKSTNVNSSSPRSTSPRSTSPSSASPKNTSPKSSSKSSGSGTGKSSSSSQSHTSSAHTTSSQSSGPTCINKGGMSVAVKHILIGPVDPCPISGNKPCTGAACIKAAEAASKSPISISNVNNPRRGVFELVIRKINGAPLARNELMLEWTLPQPNPPPCATPCPPLPCAIPCYKPCRSKCKIVCRPSRCAMPCRSCCGIPCKRPCGIPCAKPCCVPCRRPCGRSCKKPCFTPCKRPCGPMPPCLSCRSCCKTSCGPPYCPPSPCSPCSPCRPLLCDGPVCCSSPCLRPCPVGRRRPRRCRSHPRIKPHKVFCSPCKNRSRCCPVVRCRSLPLPLPKLCNPYRPPYCPPFACSRCVSTVCLPC